MTTTADPGGAVRQLNDKRMRSVRSWEQESVVEDLIVAAAGPEARPLVSRWFR